jgi:hypothetical protein
LYKEDPRFYYLAIEVLFDVSKTTKNYKFYYELNHNRSFMYEYNDFKRYFYCENEIKKISKNI